MKKLFYLFLIPAFAFISCDSNTLQVDEEALANGTNAIDSIIYRTQSEAIEIANSFAQFNTNSRSTTKVALPNVNIIYNNNLTRSTSEPLIYAINYNDNQGYILIPALRRADEIIAAIDNGQYSEADIINNPGYNDFIDCAMEVLQSMSYSDSRLGGGGIDPGDISTIKEQKQETTIVNDECIEPRVKYDRGQSWPEGIYCSNGLSGCAPTALFMACEYFKEPKEIRITFEPKYDQPLDWDEFVNIKSSNYDPGTYKGNRQNQIGKFLRQIGELSDSKYKNGSTPTPFDKLRSTAISILGTLHVTKMHDYDFMTLRSHIRNGGIAVGMGTTKNLDMCHAWVYDGYKYQYIVYDFYERPKGKSEWTLVDTKYHTEALVHINWGWLGKQNGWFNQSLLYYEYYEDGERKTDQYVRSLKFFTITNKTE